jgi:hypothetical protein
MDLTDIFDRLWRDYSEQNPSVNKIAKLFENKGEVIVNDHIAFRTLDLPEISIDELALPFTGNGYVPVGEYIFKDKHLFAKHFELPEDESAPRVFISQLILSDCSPYIQTTFKEAFARVDSEKIKSETMIFSGTIFKPLSFETYNRLRDESEYAAWFYVFGFRANHFTVSVNALKKYNTIVKVNELLKENGFTLNTSGGEVKGLVTDLLQQSSTMSDMVKVEFTEGIYEIPSCYYEFAQRYPDTNGELYSGFIAKSADKIFESTNYKRT